jgi:CheY-like chemotaxis protein
MGQTYCGILSMKTPDQILNIYLADDDDADQFLFKEALEEMNLKTSLTIADSGIHLFRLLLDEALSVLPDIIFMDINMPIKNGFECLDELKQNENLKDIPVVMLSSSCLPESERMALKLGASKYICKPNTFDALVKEIKEVLTMHGSINSWLPIFG